MKRPAVFVLVLLLLMRAARGQDRPEQGDVNGDGRRNVSDAVYLLRYIFADGPEPVDGPCAACDSCCPKISRLLKTGFNLSLDLETGWTSPEPVPRFCGEDGCDQAGASRHYELLTFGSQDPWHWITVDYATGLMWQTQCPEDKFDGLGQAIAYCDDLTLGPFDDWRLPGINELLTLVTLRQYGGFDPLCGCETYQSNVTMERAFFRWYAWPSFLANYWYWSSTITSSWQTFVCQVGFGPIPFYGSWGTTFTGYARAVRQVLPGDLGLLGLPEKPSGFRREAPRNGDVDGNGARDVEDAIYLLAYLFTGGPAPAPNDCPACDSCCPDFPAKPLQTGATGALGPGVPRSFEVLTFGSEDRNEWVTVDHATGLMWQYAYEGRARNYVEAVDLWRRFSDRRLGGFGDWRIPNIFEILSLVNYSPNGQHDYPAVFESPPSDYSLLSSTLDVRYPSTINDCARSFSLSQAYTLNFELLRLHYHGLLQGNSLSVYLRFVRTIQPGDLER